MKRKMTVLIVMILLLCGALSAADAKTSEGFVLIRAKFKCGCSRDGMGTMIADNGLVTAAHNIVCHKHNRDLKECNFFFGWDGKTYSKKYNGYYSYRWYSDFSNGFNSSYDLAYVVFKNKAVNDYFDYGVVTDSYDYEYTIRTIKVYGYNGGRLMEDWGSITYHESTNEISWPMSSSFKECVSGGPIMYSITGSEQHVMGVYTSISGNTAYGSPLTPQLIVEMIEDGAHVEPF